MEKVAVTGGGGLIGRHVIQRLLENNDVAQIRVIERDRSQPIDFNDVRVKVTYADVNDRPSLERVLKDCDAVVHCAHAPLPFRYLDDAETAQMWHDNLSATESVVDVMVQNGVKTLVHVGDAYSALPIEDNYGLGVEMFSDFPRNYMLGEFGESRTRGEMYARKATERGQVNGLFLRPVFVYGRDGSRTMDQLQELISNKQLPYIEGDRRGMHQFIHAGNLASIVEKALAGLCEDEKKFSGEIVYCLDETAVFPIREFIERRFPSTNYTKDTATSFFKAFSKSYFNYLKYKLGFKPDENAMNHVMFRLIFEKTVGFSNKKLRLLLDSKPEVKQEEALEIFFNNNTKESNSKIRRENIHG